MLLRGSNHKRYERLARWFISAVFAITQTVALVFLSYTAIRGLEPAPSHAAAGIPLILNYQGKLTNAAGVTVSDGDQSMVVVIYDAATSGNCLYAMRGTCASPTAETVTVTSGIFTIQIGDSSDNTLSLNFNDDSYYLGIKVSTDSEMTPRKRITAAGYAVNSDRLDGYSASVTAGANAIPATDNSGNLIITTRVYFGTSTTSTTSGRVYVDTASASQSGLLIRGAVSQLANLAIFQNDVASVIGWVSASGGFGASGTSLMRTINADTNNTYDLGSFGNAWRTVYASNSVNVGSGSASATISSSGNINLTGHILPAAVNSSDIGSLSLGFRNIFASTSVNVSSGAASATISSNGNILLTGRLGVNTSTFFANTAQVTIQGGDLQIGGGSVVLDNGRSFGIRNTTAVVREILAVDTSDRVTITNGNPNVRIMLDTGGVRLFPTGGSETYTQGALLDTGGNFIASSSLRVTLGSASTTISSSGNITITGGIFPASNNASASDLGAFGTAWNEIYVSGTARFGSSTNSISINSDAGTASFMAAVSANSAKTFLTLNQNTSSTVNLVNIADDNVRPIFWINQHGGVGSSATFFMGPGTTLGEAVAATSTVNSNLFVRGNIQGGGDISVAGNCQEAGGACADVAELYPSEEPVEPGDVLSASENSGLNGTVLVRKSNQPLASNIVGIVSTNPGITLGVNGVHIGKRTGSELEPLIALAGRVPLKVTNEGGEIKPGDLLVSASTLGHAMRYDPAKSYGNDSSIVAPAILGVALESFKQDAPGKILVLVRSGYIKNLVHFSGQNSSKLNIHMSNGDIVYKDIDLGGKSIINAKSIKSISNTWEITEDGWMIAKEIRTEKLIIKNTQNKKTVDIIKIPANTKRYTVLNPTIEKTSRVFLTLRSEPVDVTWAVRSIQDGSFEIALSHEVEGELEFYYWIIGVEEELEDSDAEQETSAEVVVGNMAELNTNNTEQEDETSETPNELAVVEDDISGDAEDTTDQNQANGGSEESGL